MGDPNEVFKKVDSAAFLLQQAMATVASYFLFVLCYSLVVLSPIHAASDGKEFSVPPPPPSSFWGLQSKTALVTGGTKGIGMMLLDYLSCLAPEYHFSVAHVSPFHVKNP